MKMDELTKELGIDIPKGANAIVDQVGKEIVTYCILCYLKCM